MFSSLQFCVVPDVCCMTRAMCYDVSKYCNCSGDTSCGVKLFCVFNVHHHNTTSFYHLKTLNELQKLQHKYL